MELETQRAQLQGAAEAAAARQREVEAQNKLLHERLEKIEAGQASGDVPSPGKLRGQSPWRSVPFGTCQCDDCPDVVIIANSPRGLLLT